MRRFRKSGQTIIFLAMAMFVLLLVVLWQFDAHKILFVKAKARNGGDSAALAAARWQGSSLNLIGQLNIQQAVAIAEGLANGQVDFPDARAIAQLQARINFAGPLIGFALSQQAAKLNGIYVNEQYNSDMRAHANIVRNEYPDYYGSAYNTVSGRNSWDDYADMLEAIANEGIAAAPDNPDLIAQYQDGSHLLLNPAFYDAIASRNWCWFYHNAYDELRNYRSWRDWPPLPELRILEPINSEFYSLKLQRVRVLDQVSIPGGLGNLIDRMNDYASTQIPPEVAQVEATWYFYRQDAWTSWDRLIPDNFPWDGEIKPEANFAGADAAVRIQEDTSRHTTATGADVITWSAAAKSFGGLPGNRPPHVYGMVLPTFEQTAMIPVDTSSAPSGNVRAGWLTFIYELLPIYMQSGPYVLPQGNFFADQLRTWERSGFRNDGITWLNQNSDLCNVSGGGGGGGGGGGTRRGH